MARPWKDFGRYGSVGFELVLTILIVSGIGHWWDGRYGHGGGWGLIVGFLIGVAVGFYNLFKTAQGMQRDIERAEANEPLAPGVRRWTVDEGWLYKPDDAGSSFEPGSANGGHSGDGHGTPGHSGDGHGTPGHSGDGHGTPGHSGDGHGTPGRGGSGPPN